MKPANLLPVLAVSLLAAALVTGCGSSSSSSGPDTAPVASDPVAAILGPGMTPPLPADTWIDLPPTLADASFPADLLPPGA